MSENKVLAVVNSREVTEMDVDLLYKSLNPQQAAQFASAQGKNALLNEIINQELFYADAVDNDLEKEEEFVTELENMKVTLIKQYALRKLLNSVKIEDEEIEKYYEEHMDMFKTEESVRASHILIDNEDKAKEIIAEIKEGLSFEDAAKKYSSCPSNSVGGDLNYFTKGQMVPEFEAAAFTLALNELSEPVKTQFGYHIIKVTDKKAGGTKTLEESRQQVYSMLLGTKQNKVYLDKVEELKAKYDVKITE